MVSGRDPVPLERGRECLFELATFEPATADVRDLVAAARALRDANRALVRAIRERVEQVSRSDAVASWESAARILWPEHLPRPTQEQLDIALLDEVRDRRVRPPRELPVTERQIEILLAAQAGESVGETADRLGIRVNNVYVHRQRIRRRLVGLGNTTFADAIQEAVRLGLIPGGLSRDGANPTPTRRVIGRQ